MKAIFREYPVMDEIVDLIESHETRADRRVLDRIEITPEEASSLIREMGEIPSYIKEVRIARAIDDDS